MPCPGAINLSGDIPLQGRILKIPLSVCKSAYTVKYLGRLSFELLANMSELTSKSKPDEGHRPPGVHGVSIDGVGRPIRLSIRLSKTGQLGNGSRHTERDSHVAYYSGMMFSRSSYTYHRAVVPRLQFLAHFDGLHLSPYQFIAKFKRSPTF